MDHAALVGAGVHHITTGGFGEKRQRQGDFVYHRAFLRHVVQLFQAHFQAGGVGTGVEGVKALGLQPFAHGVFNGGFHVVGGLNQGGFLVDAAAGAEGALVTGIHSDNLHRLILADIGRFNVCLGGHVDHLGAQGATGKQGGRGQNQGCTQHGNSLVGRYAQ